MAANLRERVLVDPAVKEAEDAFARMMARFTAMTREEHVAFEVGVGLRRPDGRFAASDDETGGPSASPAGRGLAAASESPAP
jgi:hypothetical protein